MLVGGMVGYEIENKLEAAFMDGLQQLIEVGQGSKNAVDIAVVGDVVAEVGHGRRIEGRDPHRFDPQAGEVI